MTLESIETLVKQFELKLINPEMFHHQEHIQIAWWYLHHYSLVEAIAKFSQGLKSFAASLGKETLYHETITWSYILLINERIHKRSITLDWELFYNENKDLFDWKNNLLNIYYKKDTLDSDIARQVFVFPDKHINL